MTEPKKALSVEEFAEKWIISRVYTPFPEKKKAIADEMKADLEEMMKKANADGIRILALRVNELQGPVDPAKRLLAFADRLEKEI